MSIARVLHIESGSGFGGSATGLVNLAPKLALEGFEPLIGYYHKGLQITELEQRGIPIAPIRKWHAFEDVCRLIRRHQIDLVHFNNEIYSHMPGMLAATALKVRRICHMRGIRPFTHGEHFAKHLVDQFVAISDVGYKLYTDEGIPASRIRRIYNSIDLTRYAQLPPRSTLRRLLGLPADGLVVGFVSRVEPEKGHREFMDTAALVLQQRPDVTFAIVGGDVTPKGVFLDELKQGVAARGLEKQILFLGWRRDIPEVTSCFDVAVQASRYVEGLGRSLLEAMAVSLPVVATRTGGFCEVVEEGVTGLLTPVGDSPAMSAALLRLLADPAQRQAMGVQGRRRVEAQFDAKVQIQEFKRLFLDVLARPYQRWHR